MGRPIKGRGGEGVEKGEGEEEGRRREKERENEGGGGERRDGIGSLLWEVRSENKLSHIYKSYSSSHLVDEE